MNQVKSSPVFYVQNKIRCANFLLLYALGFLLISWLIPSPFNWIGIGVLILSLVSFAKSDGMSRKLKNQTFDRIALKKFGVEYSSGAYGDEWLRPYNEFRVEYQIKKFLFLNLYRVRLKHKVLDNLLIESTRSREQAENTVRALIENSRLRLLK